LSGEERLLYKGDGFFLRKVAT